MLRSLRYATLVWLTGLCTIPTVFVAGMALGTKINFFDALYGGRWLWWEMIQNFGVWSVPAWLLFLRATYFVCKTAWGKWEKKWALFWVALVLVLISGAIFSRRDFSMLLLYWIPGILSVFVFQLPKIEQNTTELKDE